MTSVTYFDCEEPSKKTQPKQKVAYKADTEDGGSFILFVHSANELKRTDEYEQITRTPEYDNFASLGYVPAQQLHEEGWTFNCHECETEINSECFDYQNDLEIQPVFASNLSFCSQECYQIFIEERAERIKAKLALQQKYSGITNIATWRQPDNEIVIHFKFPGGKDYVEWKSSDPDHVWITQKDTEKWDEYKKVLGDAVVAIANYC